MIGWIFLDFKYGIGRSPMNKKHSQETSTKDCKKGL